jgi:cell division protein FtsI (penicillin-binding protein 3)
MMRFKGKVAHKFAESPLLQMRLPLWRSRLMALLILGSFGVLIGRAFYLQVLNNDFLQEKGESRYRRDIEISASRGRIADRHGDVLAISTPMKSIWAIPPATTLTPVQTRQLAALLETDVKQLTRKLDTDKTFVFLRRQIPPAGGRPGGGAQVAWHRPGQGVPSLLSDR